MSPDWKNDRQWSICLYRLNFTAIVERSFISVLSIIVGLFICLVVLAIGMRRMAQMDAGIDQIYRQESRRQAADGRERLGRPASQHESERGYRGAAESLSRDESEAYTEKDFRALMIQHILVKDR